MDSDPYDFSLKVVISGNASVGKTNIIQRYVHNSFLANNIPTLGIDFALKDFVLEEKRIRCQLWDTAGQEKLQSIAKMFYKNADGAIFVYDVTKKESFESIPKWINELKENSDEKISIILLGNKKDLQTLREVPIEKAQRFASETGIFFTEISALENSQNEVQIAIDALLWEIITKLSGRKESESAKKFFFERVKLRLNKETKKDAHHMSGDCC